MENQGRLRQAYYQALRDAVRDDPWLASYALFWLLDDVDLEQLGRLVDKVLENPEAMSNRTDALSQLFQERWGRP